MNSQHAQAVALIRQAEWDAAHELVQTGRDPVSCWIHAWLHRQEGDLGNAAYWYRMAGRDFPEADLESELAEIEQATSG